MYPWLKMAQGEKDTGVIVSFNSEAEGIKTLGINPLNWKTDTTIADSSQNKGACFTNYDGKIKEEKEHFSGAYIDKERGSLIVTDVKPSDYSNSLFPNGIYHLYDYQFFYRNLQKNVLDRVNAFKTNQKENEDKSNEKIINKGWNKVNNIWYMTNIEGQIVKGWYKEKGKWYYLDNETGAMKTGWFKDIDGKWYYLNSDGSIAVNTTIDGYEIGNDGAWLN